MKIRLWSAAIACVLLTVLASSCNSKSAAAEGVKLQGAGASFPAPLYNKWFKSYSASHPDVQVDYQSVGSGSGKKSVIDHTVDFGASDAAMSEEEMARVPGGVQLLPMTAGAIVIAYNVDGRERAEALAQGLYGHLPGENQELERSRNCRRQSQA